MFTDLFESAARVHALRDGPAGTLLEAFAQALVRDRYAPITARRHLRAAEHFVHWADRTGIPVTGAIGPVLERFARHLLRAGRCPHFGHTFRVEILHGARLFLTHLQDVGLIDGSTVDSTVVTPSLITEFRQWMQQQRGTCESTVSNYEVHIRETRARGMHGACDSLCWRGAARTGGRRPRSARRPFGCFSGF
jgi:integrase/recombinase XerD